MESFSTLLTITLCPYCCKVEKDGGKNKKVTLLSLTSKRGFGVSIKSSKSGRRFIVRSVGETGEAVFKCEVPFKTQRWHLFAVTHTSPYLKSSEVCSSCDHFHSHLFFRPPIINYYLVCCATNRLPFFWTAKK
jgi:hypothetical protein